MNIFFRIILCVCLCMCFNSVYVYEYLSLCVWILLLVIWRSILNNLVMWLLVCVRERESMFVWNINLLIDFYIYRHIRTYHSIFEYSMPFFINIRVFIVMRFFKEINARMLMRDQFEHLLFYEVDWHCTRIIICRLMA